MPGRLPGPFRPGNLAENLGVLLLRGIAAVAEVPRPDDIGIDAFCTLLRRDEADGHYYAEDGFIVQLKSDSDRPLTYDGHELEWLTRQSQPMFIGKVSLPESSISLYPTWSVTQAVSALYSTRAAIYFTSSNLPDIFRGVPSRWVGGSGKNEVKVYVPEPLLRWSVADLTDQNWRESAYRSIKAYCSEHRRAAHAFAFGQSLSILWNTNSPDSIRSGSTISKGHPDDLQELTKQVEPALNALSLHATAMPDEIKQPMLLAVLAILSGLKSCSVLIGPDSHAEITCLLGLMSGRGKLGPVRLPQNYTIRLDLITDDAGG